MTSRWAYCLLVPEPRQWSDEAALEAAKRQLLREVIARLLAGRRWFFRRCAIEKDRLGWLHDYSVAAYVELAPNDDLECLRQVMEYELTAGCGHAVLEVRDWNGCFGKDYGGPASQAAMRDFACEAAHAAIVEQRDPFDVALKHAARGQAPLDGIKHWWMWLRVGEIMDKASLDQCWAAMLARRDHGA